MTISCQLVTPYDGRVTCSIGNYMLLLYVFSNINRTYLSSYFICWLSFYKIKDLLWAEKTSSTSSFIIVCSCIHVFLCECDCLNVYRNAYIIYVYLEKYYYLSSFFYFTMNICFLKSCNFEEPLVFFKPTK